MRSMLMITLAHCQKKCFEMNLQGEFTKSNLLQEFLLALLVDDGVGVSHHGDQHVEEEDGQDHLEDDEEGLADALVVGLRYVVVLDGNKIIKSFDI